MWKYSVVTSMSLSRFLNWSMAESALIPPQLLLERKSTGLVMLGTDGKRRRKSSSPGSILLFISSTCVDSIIRFSREYIQIRAATHKLLHAP